jgi:hypothetical protein
VSSGLRALAAAGYIEEQPFEPLANVIVGALNYGMMAVAASRDPAAARPTAEEAIERLLRGLRID